jgi:hypothetical protein
MLDVGAHADAKAMWRYSRGDRPYTDLNNRDVIFYHHRRSFGRREELP